MSRQLEAKLEQKQTRERDATLLAVYGGLEDAVQHAGGVLTGFSVRLSEVECLMTLRADFPAGRQVAFCGGEDLTQVFRKAAYEASTDALRWRADVWET